MSLGEGVSRRGAGATARVGLGRPGFVRVADRRPAGFVAAARRTGLIRGARAGFLAVAVDRRRTDFPGFAAALLGLVLDRSCTDRLALVVDERPADVAALVADRLVAAFAGDRRGLVALVDDRWRAGVAAFAVDRRGPGLAALDVDGRPPGFVALATDRPRPGAAALVFDRACTDPLTLFVEPRSANFGACMLPLRAGRVGLDDIPHGFGAARISPFPLPR